MCDIIGKEISCVLIHYYHFLYFFLFILKLILLHIFPLESKNVKINKNYKLICQILKMQSSVHQGRTWLYRFHPHVHSAALWEPPGQKALVGPVKTHWINADFSFEEQSPVFSHKKTSGFIAHYKDIMINETLQIMKKNNNLHMMIHIMEFFLSEGQTELNGI